MKKFVVSLLLSTAAIAAQPTADEIKAAGPVINWLGEQLAATTTTTAPAATGKTYYVSASSGVDANSGTADAPFRTLQIGVNMAQPGDSVVVKAGVYISGSTAAAVPIASIKKSGTADKPITIRSAPGEVVILDGRSITTTLVEVRGSYINLEGLELKDAKRTAVLVVDDNKNGVVDVHHINVRLCYAHHNNHEPKWIGGAFGTVGPVDRVVFEDCMAHDNSIGFEIRESPTQRAATALVPPATMPESDWDAWPGWTQYSGHASVIRRCLAFNNRLIDEMSDGIGCRYAIECTFEDNISFGNGDDNYDLLGSTRCTVRRNIGFNANPLGTTDGDGNGMKVGVRGGLDNVIYNNILFNNPRAGIDVADTERAKVYNNTCVNNSWFGIWFEAGRATAGGATVLNNICKANKQGDMGRTAQSKIIRADYNCVSDNNDRSPVPRGDHGLIATDPKFSNEPLVVDTSFPADLTIPQKCAFIRDQVKAKLSLAAGSPCIDTGVDVGLPFTSKPDIGALETK